MANENQQVHERANGHAIAAEAAYEGMAATKANGMKAVIVLTSPAGCRSWDSDVEEEDADLRHFMALH